VPSPCFIDEPLFSYQQDRKLAFHVTVFWLSISGYEITNRSKQEAEKISQNEHAGSVYA
jgi:hypothetical protein